MKWVIAELIIDTANPVRNDEDEEVFPASWIRRSEEFERRAEAIQWIAQQPNRLLEDGKTQRFEARRLEDGFVETVE